jgi:hypothetical protein
VGEILGLEASFYLDDLLSQGLIYCDPSRELSCWRPTQSALLALGLRSHTDIPALKELEEWFDTQKGIWAYNPWLVWIRESPQSRRPHGTVARSLVPGHERRTSHMESPFQIRSLRTSHRSAGSTSI